MTYRFVPTVERICEVINMSDLIRKDDALMEARPEYLNPQQQKLASYNQGWNDAIEEYYDRIKSLSSAEPKTETVLCALADRLCPFQGKEYAWCLTCPHISEEDRELVRKAINPRTGEWIDWLGKGNEWECSVCKCSIESHGSIAYKYCPNCGADMRGEKHEEQ